MCSVNRCDPVLFGSKSDASALHTDTLFFAHFLCMSFELSEVESAFILFSMYTSSTLIPVLLSEANALCERLFHGLKQFFCCTNLKCWKETWMYCSWQDHTVDIVTGLHTCPPLGTVTQLLPTQQSCKKENKKPRCYNMLRPSICKGDFVEEQCQWSLLSGIQPTKTLIEAQFRSHLAGQQIP